MGARTILYIFFGFFASTSGYARTAEDCRSDCRLASNGYCIAFGLQGLPSARPYLDILRLTEGNLNGSTRQPCQQNVDFTPGKARITGDSCTLSQTVQGVANLETRFSGSAHAAVITSASGEKEIQFDSGNPTWKLANADGSNISSGPVQFITSGMDSGGERTVIWYDGDYCFSFPRRFEH